MKSQVKSEDIEESKFSEDRPSLIATETPASKAEVKCKLRKPLPNSLVLRPKLCGMPDKASAGAFSGGLPLLPTQTNTPEVDTASGKKGQLTQLSGKLKQCSPFKTRDGDATPVGVPDSPENICLAQPLEEKDIKPGTFSLSKLFSLSDCFSALAVRGRIGLPAHTCIAKFKTPPSSASF